MKRFITILLPTASLFASVDTTFFIDSNNKSLLIDISKRFDFFSKNISINTEAVAKIAKSSKANITTLSLEYYPFDNSLLSFGRVKLDLDLMQGSFDGAYFTYINNNLQARAFYFKHYLLLKEELYKNKTLKGLYGLSFDYSFKHLNISNTTFKNIGLYSYSNINLNSSIATLGYSKLYYKSNKYKEKANIFYIDFDLTKFNYTLYYAKNYKNALNKVFNYGSINSINPAIYYSLNSPYSTVKLMELSVQKENLYFSASIGQKEDKTHKKIITAFELGVDKNSYSISLDGYAGDQKKISLLFKYRIGK